VSAAARCHMPSSAANTVTRELATVYVLSAEKRSLAPSNAVRSSELIPTAALGN
jgi:hypothetical protein